MRKVFLCCMIVVMLVCCAVPTFAIGSGAAKADVFPVVPFDYLNFYGASAYYTAPFPFGNGVMSGGISNFDYFDMDDYPEAFGYQGTADDDGDGNYTIVGDISFADFDPDDMSFTLTAYNKILDTTAINGQFRILYDLGNIRINNTDLYVEYYVKTKSTSGDRWIFEKRTASWTEGYYPNNVIDASYNFNRIASQAGTTDLFVSYMEFTVYYRRVGVATPSFDFEIGCTRDYVPGADFNTWAYIQDLEVEETVITPPADTFDIWTWLMDTIEHFVELEIFPGFSINKLYWLVLVIGVVLWFITLLI